MADLIQDSCNLSLPEGLKDLMSDITREILRTQPEDVYKFIANYLEALIEVRETLAIACRICAETCECSCESELFQELRDIGLCEEDADNAVNIVQKFLESGSVKEQTILSKLLKKINIEEEQVIPIQKAIQRVFTRYQPRKSNIRAEDEFISSEFKPPLRTASSTSLAGSYTKIPQYHGNPDPTMLSKISEECSSFDYTIDTSQVIQKITFSKSYSPLTEDEQNETFECSHDMDIILDNNQNVQITGDCNIQEDSVSEEIYEENNSECSSIEESLHNSP
ncbi:unnamed protein product, partial [Brenthis ino]